MRIFLALALLIYYLPFAVFAENDADSEKDLTAYKKYQEDNFRDFPTTGPGINAGKGGYGGGSYNGSNIYKQFKNFPEGDSRNYVKKTIMDKISTLAQGLATTAGSALSFDNALQLRTQANQLSATGDPTFQQMASLLKQEATAIESGDKTAATGYANQITDMQRPYVSSSYTPGPQENQFADALNNILGTIIQGALAILGTQLVGQLLTALGLGSGGSFSGSFGSGLGSIGSSAVKGQNPSGAVTNATFGVMNAGGNDVNTATQRQIKATVNDGSSGGGAPAASSK